MATNNANIKLVTSLVFILASTVACASVAITPDSLDRHLINSLARDDLASAREYLVAGANPEAILGKNTTDNAVCTAIDDRHTEKLELLVEFGASPNAYWRNAHLVQRTPLVCSILYRNFEAFEYLLEHGADPSLDLDPEGLEKFRYRETAFTSAIGYKVYPMALELLKHHELHPNEIKYAATRLEKSPYDRAHPWSYHRDEIHKWLLQRVPDFKPAQAGVGGKSREKNECYFSARDRRERLKKGTMCPPPE